MTLLVMEAFITVSTFRDLRLSLDYLVTKKIDGKQLGRDNLSSFVLFLSLRNLVVGWS